MIHLLEKKLSKDPIEQFDRWFKVAVKKCGLEMAEAMCLSTLDPDGFPDGRMVLLKQYNAEGFVFYTNLHSVKGQSLLKNARAALTFHWIPLQRQVRLQGTTCLLSDQEADSYFHSRPRLSQLGAWASRQSEPLKSRTDLVRQVAQLELKYKGGQIPRPPYWTGFRLKPRAFEFWQAGRFRLHDRFRYTSSGPGRSWTVTRLYP